MKKIISVILIIAALAAALSISASALVYTFRARDNTDFYRPTPFEEVFGSQFNYGGMNVTDFHDVSRLPGIFSLTPQTAPPGSLIPGISAEHNISTRYMPTFTSSITSWDTTAFTPTSELRRADGSIGTLIIPSLSINIRVFEGATQESMRRGLGHFSDTSGWNGDIGIAGVRPGRA